MISFWFVTAARRSVTESSEKMELRVDTESAQSNRNQKHANNYLLIIK